MGSPENKKRSGKVPANVWKPGQSGNPGGRPKEVAHVKELARTYTEEAIQTLAEVMRSEQAPFAARVKASETLLDRAWGKSEATVNVKDVRDVRDLSRAEILAALASHGIIGEAASAGEPGPVH